MRDDASTMEDNFIADELFSDTNSKDTKNLVEVIKQETDVNDILFDRVPIDTTLDVPPLPDPSFDLSDILLPKNKEKNVIVKKVSKTYKKIRQKRDKTKKLTKKSYWQHEKI